MLSGISHIVIRADASTAIGNGHIIRMLVLAETLSTYGLSVTFACMALEGHMTSFIEQKGYAVIPCHAVDDMVWLDDIASTPRTTLIVLDHYGLGITYESQLIEKGYRLLVVDDLARAHHCHYLLDSSLHLELEKRYNGIIPDRAYRFLGPDYALICPNFAASARQRETIQRLLVCMGGTDPHTVTTTIIEGLRNTISMAVDIVIGAHHPERNRISTLCEAWPHAALHIQTDRMVELMTDADMAILSGGCNIA